MKLYVYCVARSVENLAELPRGIDDQELRVLQVEDFSIVVSKFSGDAVSVNRDNVVRHDAVIRAIFARTTPLPFRFGTLTSEESLHTFVAARRDALVKRLDVVQHSVEMNVKVIWSKVGDSEFSENKPTDLGPGASFLLEKQRELRGAEKLRNEAEGISNWLGGLLIDVCKESRVNLEPSQKLVYSGAYLLEQSSVTEFREILGSAKSDRPDLHFMVSGPWPPYTFADIDLEFKSQFGVS